MYIAFIEHSNLEKSVNIGELLYKFISFYAETFNFETQAVFLGSGLRYSY